MVGRDVIREQRLDIDCYPSPGFQYPGTLGPYVLQPAEILVPLPCIVMWIARVCVPEIIRWGGDDKVDAVIGKAGKDLRRIATDDPVEKRPDFIRFGNIPEVLCLFGSLPDPFFSGLVPYFFRSQNRPPLLCSTYVPDELKRILLQVIFQKMAG